MARAALNYLHFQVSVWLLLGAALSQLLLLGVVSFFLSEPSENLYKRLELYLSKMIARLPQQYVKLNYKDSAFQR
jgi:hypothetical protein